MSLEDAIKANTKAVEENSALLEKLLKGGGAAAPADKEDTGSRRGRGRSSDDGDKASDKSLNEDDFRASVKKFMDVEDDAEYERRLKKVLDPVLEKADVKELKDLPKKHWQAVLDNIADYSKESGGSRRRAV